jgi:thiol-disulfide isomerase/thioredoxin
MEVESPEPIPMKFACRALPGVVLSSFVWLSAHAQTPAPPTHADAPAYESDPKYKAELAEAKQEMRQRQYVFARSSYAKANKIAGGNCGPCLDEMSQLDEALHNWKDAIAEAQHLQTLATTPREKSLAESRLGQILLTQGGDKPKPAQLDAAHTAFQAALTDFPKNNGARWSDACVLARLGKEDDAKDQFTACAQSAAASDPMRVRALHFAENPSLSLHKMAPAFEVTALDGTHFNLDNMGGRVVLIDFWATWCGPCNEELPNVQKIAKEFANEPFVLISISWDADEAKWKDFIAKHEMTWLQYRDADHKLSNEFGINAIPHYFTIDSDGVLTAEMLGSGNDVEGKIKKLIKRAKESKALANQVASNVSGAQ